MTSVYTLRRTVFTWRMLAWVSAIFLLVMDVSYSVLDLLPFYANGIAGARQGAILGGALDPKGYPPYSWGGYGGFGDKLLTSAIDTHFLVKLVVPFVTFLLSTALLFAWRKIGQQERLLLLGIASVSLLLVISVWTVHAIIYPWLAD